MCCKHMFITERGTIDGTKYAFLHRAGSWCEFASAKGCELHGTGLKPLSCRTFACAWLLGVGEDDDRPDKSKIIGSFETRSYLGGPAECCLVTYECAPDANRTKRAQRFMRKVAATAESMSIESLESVPYGADEHTRLAFHKKHGALLLKISEQDPEPLDADAELRDIQELFGTELPEDLSRAVAGLAEHAKLLSPEHRETLLKRIEARNCVRRGLRTPEV